jgi:putative ABC transport system permease protein
MGFMSLSDIWFLYRARLRARAVLVQEGFAIAGIAVGVALLFASQVASMSLTHSVGRMSEQIVGNTQFQLDARGPRGLDERVLLAVRSMPGVRVALPVLEQQVNAVGPDGERSVYLLGTDPRLARFAGPSLRRFSGTQLAAQHAVAFTSPMAQAIGVGPLQSVRLQMGSKVILALVGATLGEGDIGELVHSPVAIGPLRYIQQITGMTGRISRVFVAARAHHEHELRERLAGLARVESLSLEPASFDSKLFAVAAAPASQSETLFSTISALVGFMFALNAMLVTVPSRRRLIADVRHHGATRWMTIEILLFDVLVLGVLACVLGLAAGELLSIAVFHTDPSYLSIAFPVGNGRIVTWSSVVLAVAAGMAAAALGVFWPLRDLIARPLHAVEEHRSPSRHASFARVGCGSLCLAATTAILTLQPQAAIAGIVTSVVALICLLPPLFDAIVDAFHRLARPLNKTSPLLAVTELRTPQTRIRSLAIAATVAIAVFGIVAIHGSQVNLQHGLDASARDIDSSAALWVSPRGESDTFATIAFPDTDSRLLHRVPGVQTVGLYRGSFLDWGDRRLWVLAPPPTNEHPIPSSQLVKSSLADVTAKLRAGGWVLLSEKLAFEHHLSPGQVFTLPSPTPTRLHVAGLLTNLGWSPGAILMNSGDYAHAWGSTRPSAYQINLRPGASPAAVRRRVRRLLGANSGLSVETSVERERRHYATSRQGLSRLAEIRFLVLIAAVLAVSGAMGSMIWQRRELIAFIKCQGYRRGVLWRWLLCECVLLLAVGCAVGTAFGIYGQLLLSHALASVTGFPIAFHVGPTIALSSFALVTVAAVAIAGVAGYLVVRVPPRTVSSAY